MKKRSLLLLLTLLVGCGENVSSISSESSSSSSTSETKLTETQIYDFNDELKQDEFPLFNFKEKNFKEYNGSLTPTDSSLLTFTLSEDKTYYIVSDQEHKLNVNNLVIPSSYNSLPVQEIADEGFAYKTWLNSVVIPSSIKKIGAGAFNSSALKNVYYDAIEIEELNAKNWVFFKGNAEQSIDIYFGKNVKKIPNRLFFPLATNPNETCNVKNIYFSKDCQVESIGDYAFYKLSNVKEVSLPNSIKSIGKYAFYESGISEIDLSNIENIGDYAFSFASLEHVKLNNLISLGEGAFSYSKLKEIDLSNTKLTNITNFAFKKCRYLENILFNDRIESINEESFSYCSSLKQFISPKSLKNIGLKAFYNNTSLKDVRLNAINIDNYAFYNACKLEKLYIESDIDDFSLGNYVFVNAGKDSLLQVAFLEGVTKIANNFMFSNANCEENPCINELVLPSSLNEVGKGAFFDLTINSIWYLSNNSNYQKVIINEQNDVLKDVKFAFEMR